uniref:AlNc14C202G8732 protein n=1 Tax=Albugo laibachii Nc14 TaxID=890382 RepID=F0WQS2_9STRA|nr:AlNc14C202G8732 [Albugo laibachii Nc14]CCA27023.1 AlNc14C443G11687 [Albugo laibachii Nc14]|eukprot:CCA27023.1 AlNc14C443G11687 [Albugo laibachii Nc14]
MDERDDHSAHVKLRSPLRECRRRCPASQRCSESENHDNLEQNNNQFSSSLIECLTKEASLKTSSLYTTSVSLPFSVKSALLTFSVESFCLFVIHCQLVRRCRHLGF